jgi:glycosyltransferase involved in cell wall biosynthesis
MDDFRLIIVDDASTDDTERVCRKIMSIGSSYNNKKIAYFRNDVRQGPLASRITGAGLIHEKPNAMIVTIDGDDTLAHPHVFQQIVESQRSGKFVIYGRQQVVLNGQHTEIKGDEYPDKIKTARSYRSFDWLCGQPRCASYGLIKTIPISELKMNNNWFTAATDMALFIPLMERAWDRVACLPGVAYHYHRRTKFDEKPQSHVFYKEQKQSESIIRSRPVLRPIVPPIATWL